MKLSDISARLPVVLDMETSDPDDFLTLLLLAGHPKVELKAVTITPGSAAQVGVVQAGLSWLGKDIPVGAFNLEHPKDCVSEWHYRAYGSMPPSRKAHPGWEVLREVLSPDTLLITGAALKNIGRLLAESEGEAGGLGRITVQGGFAGEGVVPSELQLPKFRGLTTCPSFNLNGDPKAVFRLLESRQFKERRFVSKNVCHGVIYNQEVHEQLKNKERSKSLELIFQGMEYYLERHPAGKAVHDPMAALCGLEPGIAQWEEVEIYREKGEWGARKQPGSGVQIIIRYDAEAFWRLFFAI
jgi:pyrimidine-specific ribonucleoside hydrolase